MGRSNRAPLLVPDRSGGKWLDAVRDDRGAGSVADAEKIVSEIRAQGGEAAAIKADVSEARQVEELFAQTIQTYVSVDVVVQNTGVMPLSPIADGDAGAFDRVVRVNLRAHSSCWRRRRGGLQPAGRIVALSSSVLARSFPTFGPSIASKAGVEGLIHVLANELRGRNVTVNAVAPRQRLSYLLLEKHHNQKKRRPAGSTIVFLRSVRGRPRATGM